MAMEDLVVEEVADADVLDGKQVDEEHVAEILHVEEHEEHEVSWDEICSRLTDSSREDVRLLKTDRFLQLFEEKFQITSGIEAFSHIPAFLGEYLVREFDYRKFSIDLGLMDETSADDGALWTAHLSKSLTSDLVAASSLMLRLAMIIAKANGLEASDWEDINSACSKSVRMLPTLYRLQRALPGGLSAARAWKHLPHGPEDDSTHQCGNPWLSDESRVAFEEMFSLPWSRVEAVSESDKEIVGVVSGRFQVVDVQVVDEITLVSLEALYIGVAPAGFPIKATACGETVLWELESSLGRLLEPGFCMECDLYELQSMTCFMAGLSHIAPPWVP